MSFYKPVLIFLTLVSFTSALSSQPRVERASQRKVRAYRVSQPPVIDGFVNEPLWESMEPAADFVQQEPYEGRPSTERTEVRFGYDDKNLYIGIICFDSRPDQIVITQNRRDANLTDTDSIEILLDTFNDQQNAFVFGTSPTGIEYDGQISKAGQGRGGAGSPNRAGGQGSPGGGAQRGGASAFNLNWDGVWSVRSQITPRGWESEIAIPLRTLRFNPGSNQAWGVNIGRKLRRRNEQSYWSPLTRAFNFNQIDLAGSLEGLDISTQRSLKLLPYVIGGLDQNYSRTSNQSQFSRDAGLDIKYSLTSSLTLDATFNTDFAQVEVDDEQINLTRFDLFFPEKRPFFLENAGMFEFGTSREVELFFSRRIGIDPSGAEVPIDAGVRLSGKAGPYTLGALSMQTRDVTGVTPRNNFSVLRVSREMRNRSSIGMIAVNRQSVESSRLARPYNRTFGADANFGIGHYTNVFNYVATTRTPGKQGDDSVYSSSLAFDNNFHRVDAAYLDVGKNFNPEVGFTRRVGYRKPSFGYRYTHSPEGKRIRNISPHFQWNTWYTRSGNRKESGFEHYHFDTRWQDGSRFGIAWNRNFERIDQPFEVHPGVKIAPGSYGYNETVVNYATDPSKPFFASGNAATGGFYAGTIRTVNFNGGYRRGKNLTWSGGYIRNWIDLPEGRFDTDLVGLRFQWSFTPKSYFQSFTQYNSRTRQVGSNIRLALLSTSSTGFFLVYNTRVATYDYRDPHEEKRRTQNRVLFFKFNYLFDF